ncbi:MAG: neutral/alkaline non-lysosomal ceramidase N-terminal domain-containing protein [Planctomycetaceae bacterium]|nr:neutral/alkaline non-lysosomal ceramidase N-terminal domain-containing protein [Planctomycetaceae bacterium]
MQNVEFPQSRCLAGVARRDITPPVGIYHRMWGAATHDRSTGIHRPLTATVLVMRPTEAAADSKPVIFVAVDHCLLWHREMNELLDRVSESSGVERSQIVVFFSHTHAAGLMGHERVELPGGEMIPQYLADVADAISDGIREATDNTREAVLTYGTGQCSLATNRDFKDETLDRFVCGFNPEGQADDTVAVVRLSDVADQRTLATVVNYACHPTTLAWDNTLISPDYPGAMREIVEAATEAPCIFIQGASGDIGPRHGFVGDTQVADQNGRQLGYAVLSTLENLPPVDAQMKYGGAVISGATIGTWGYENSSMAQRERAAAWQAQHSEVPLDYRDDLPRHDDLQREAAEWRKKESAANEAGDADAARDARAMIERTTRRLVRVAHLDDAKTYPYPIRLWKLGDAVWLALDGEHYNVLQRNLRERFAGTPLIIGTLANGSNVWYLPDEASYGKGLYQEDASILAKGSLEKLEAALIDQVEELLQANRSE